MEAIAKKWKITEDGNDEGVIVYNKFESYAIRAKLIASAPELLEACKFLTRYANEDKTHPDDFTPFELKAHRMAIKAIKKATE